MSRRYQGAQVKIIESTTDEEFANKLEDWERSELLKKAIEERGLTEQEFYAEILEKAKRHE